MNTRNIPGGGGGGGGWHLRLTTTFCLENVGALTPHNPMGLHDLL
jgi:hypothetical protein